MRVPIPRPRRAFAQDLLLSAAIGAAVLGPVLLRRGYVLRGDLVMVPAMPWKDAWLGLDGAVPRFVPGDALLAGAGLLLPGDVVQKVLLLAIFVVGGCGLGRLLAEHPPTARVAGVVFFLWNPWMHERLAIGQWGVVMGYALLPWVVMAAERLRDADRRGWPAVVGWLGAAAVFSPASGLVALAVALSVVAAHPRVGRLVLVAGAGLGLNLPWILPSLALAPSLSVPGEQFAAFAPRAETDLGVLASLVTLGGIWKSSVVPGERATLVVLVLALGLTALAVRGLVSASRSHRARVASLAVVGLAVLLLAAVTAVPSVASALDVLASAIPAVGILRDSHRYLGPFALLLAVGFAAGVREVAGRARPGREALRGLAVVLAAAPVLALPSLAWGLRGAWSPVTYPAEWYAVREMLPSGRTVVLPWEGSYRGFDWNQRRAVLDPAPRFFPGEVLVDDRVLVGRRVLASEDPLLRRIGRAVAAPDPVEALRAAGVRAVLVEKGNGSRTVRLTGARALHDGSGLRVLDLGPARATPPPSRAARPSATARRVVIGTDAAVLLGWLTATGLALPSRRPVSRTETCRVPPTGELGGQG